MKKKMVYCLNTGQRFETVQDAAQDAGVGKSAMSQHLSAKYQARTAGGKIYMIITPEQTDEEIRARARERLAEITGIKI